MRGLLKISDPTRIYVTDFVIDRSQTEPLPTTNNLFTHFLFLDGSTLIDVRGLRLENTIHSTYCSENKIHIM